MVTPTVTPADLVAAPVTTRRRRPVWTKLTATIAIALLVPLTLVPLAYLVYGSALNT